MTHLVEQGVSCSELRNTYPNLVICKDKIDLPESGVEEALEKLVENHPEAEINTLDGVKFDLNEGWVHLRRSNTEPIIRVYAEASTEYAANALAGRFKSELLNLL